MHLLFWGLPSCFFGEKGSIMWDAPVLKPQLHPKPTLCGDISTRSHRVIPGRGLGCLRWNTLYCTQEDHIMQDTLQAHTSWRDKLNYNAKVTKRLKALPQVWQHRSCWQASPHNSTNSLQSWPAEPLLSGRGQRKKAFRLGKTVHWFYYDVQKCSLGNRITLPKLGEYDLTHRVKSSILMH